MNKTKVKMMVIIVIALAIVYLIDIYSFRVINMTSGELKFELLRENNLNSIINFSFDINTLLTISLLFTTIIYTYITKGILADQHGPRLFAIGELVDSENQYDARVMEPFGFGNLEGEGFTYSTEDYKWILSLKNNGDRPATRIIIKFEITLYKNEITFGTDKADVIDYHPIVHKRVFREVEVDYIPPGGSISEVVYYMQNCPEAEIAIISLKSKESKYIKERIVISKYRHSEFERLEDSHHVRQMLGVN